MDVGVHDHRAEARYEARLGTELVGMAEYTLDDAVITFTHTEVEPEHREQGVAEAIVRYSLDDARKRGLLVVPRCPFYRHFVDTHAEYADLVSR